MWAFHLTKSPLPMIGPKVKLSQWDKKQSKKQFTWLTISSLPRGAVEDMHWKERGVSPPRAFPAVEPGPKGCDAPAQASGDCNVHRFVVWPPRASRAWTRWRRQLMRCGSAGSIRRAQFLALASRFHSPSVYPTFLMVSFGNASF